MAVTTTIVPLTEQEIQQTLKQAQAAAQSIANSATPAAPSNQFVFFAAFDGTKNASIPDEDQIQGTAVYELYKQAFVNIGDNARYYPGVGTPGTLPGSDGLNRSNVVAQAIITAQRAYSDFAQEAFAWLQANPGGSVKSMTVGFSRGCAAQAIFAQMLYENGLTYNGKVLVSAGAIGVVSAALAIDPVLTEDAGNMDFPPGVRNFTVVRAENEYRLAFFAADYGADGETLISVPGAHNDAGDGYDDGLGGIYLGAYTSFFTNAGLNIGAVNPDRTFQSSIVIHSENLSLADATIYNKLWDLDYNPFNDLDVIRLTDSAGSPVVVQGSATVFTAYNGDIVIGGTGYSYTTSPPYNPNPVNLVLLPRTIASVTSPISILGFSIEIIDVTMSQSDTLILSNNLSGTISGFAPGDTINLAGMGTASNAFLGRGNVLYVNGASAPIALQLDPSQDYSIYSFAVADDGSGGTDITVVSKAADLYSVAPNDTWASIAKVYGINAATLEALNQHYLSDQGSIIAYIDRSNLYAGAAIRVPTAVSSGVPTPAMLQGLDQQHTLLYDRATDRTYTVPALIDGSDGGHFQVVDDRGAGYGRTLADVVASEVTSLTVTPIPGSTSINTGDLAITTVTNGTLSVQKVSGSGYYTLQPGDTPSSIIALTGVGEATLLQATPNIVSYVDYNNNDYSASVALNTIGNPRSWSGTGQTELTLSSGDSYVTLGVNSSVDFGVIRLQQLYADDAYVLSGGLRNLDDQYFGAFPQGFGVYAQFISSSIGWNIFGNETQYPSISFQNSLTSYPYFIVSSDYSGNIKVELDQNLVNEQSSSLSGVYTRSLPITITALVPVARSQIGDTWYTSQNGGPWYTSQYGDTWYMGVPASGTINLDVTGKFYAEALASISTGALDFGVIHVGDTKTQKFTIANVASGPLTDVLEAGVNFTALQQLEGLSTSNVTQTIGAGSQGTFSVALNASKVGNITESPRLELFSHDDQFPDAAAPSNVQQVALNATVFNYAAPMFAQASGNGILTQNDGNSWTLDLGNVDQNSIVETASFDVRNNAPAGQFSDVLSGTFMLAGSGFTVSGAAPFSGVAAGQSIAGNITVGVATSATGAHSETITLLPVSSNDAGYSGALSPVTLTITDNVVSGTTSQPSSPPTTPSTDTTTPPSGPTTTTTTGATTQPSGPSAPVTGTTTHPSNPVTTTVPAQPATTPGSTSTGGTTIVSTQPQTPTTPVSADDSVDPLFDAAYYLANNPDVAASGMAPYQHYMTYGWKEGRNPSALFSTSYYLNQNPDVAASGMNPLTHYEEYGWKEGRDPSVNFSISAYLNANPDVKAAGMDPLVHYERYGQFEGRPTYTATPHATGPQDPLVNAATIDAQRPDVATAGVDATSWYNTYGWQAGVNPNPGFDGNFYLTQNPDVKAAGFNPLQHFETYGWKEGRDPSLMFSDSEYLAANPDVKAAGIDPLVHYIRYGQSEGRMAFLSGPSATPDPLVNAAYYDKQLGATLIPTGAAAQAQAAASYDAMGWLKGLNPDQFFNTSYYLSQNPDVAAAAMDPLLHYEKYGWKEGRNPSATFSTSKYLAAYPDVKADGMNPLLHYVEYGQAEGRAIFAA